MLVVLAFVKSNAPKRRPRVQISSIKDSPPPFGGRDENFPMTSQVASEKKRKKRKKKEKKCARKKGAEIDLCSASTPAVQQRLPRCRYYSSWAVLAGLYAKAFSTSISILRLWG